MNIIVAADKNWGIGYQGQLLVSIPNDHKQFRKATVGKVVVLGRKTLETFPQQQPLEKRTNIILSRDKNYKVKDAIVVHSIEELLEELKNYNSDDVYIIGGDSIYKQMLPYCDAATVTRIDYAYQSDAYFPDLDAMEDWENVDTSEEQTYFDVEYYFVQYRKKK